MERIERGEKEKELELREKERRDKIEERARIEVSLRFHGSPLLGCLRNTCLKS